MNVKEIIRPEVRETFFMEEFSPGNLTTVLFTLNQEINTVTESPLLSHLVNKYLIKKEGSHQNQKL